MDDDKEPIARIREAARLSQEKSLVRRNETKTNRQYHTLVISIVVILVLFTAFIVVEVWLFPR